jgi:hypothetical protein
LLTGSQFSVPAITADIVNDGIVLVYIRPTGNTTSWYSLPYSEAGTNISLSDYGVGYVDIKSSISETGIDFRFVVIAGTSLTALQLSHPGVNVSDYNSVKAALNLRN